MADETTVFTPGIDYSVNFGGYSPSLNQGIMLAIPNDVRGMIQYQEDPPTLVGEPPGYPTNWYTWQERNLWIVPSTGKAYAYKAGVGFFNVANLIDNNQIVSAMIVDNTIALSKINVPGGTPAGAVVAVNGGGTALIYTPIVTNIVNNSLPVAKLTAGTNGQFISTVGGISVWHTLTGTELNSTFATGPKLAVANIATGAAFQVLRTDPTVTTVEWVDPSALIQDNTVPVSRLAVFSGNANKVVQVNALGTAMELRVLPTIPVTTVHSSAQLTLPVNGASISFAHTLGAQPTIFQCYFVCTTANNGYAINDQIPFFAVSFGNAGDEENAYSLSADSANLTLVQYSVGATNRTFLNKTTGVSVAFVQTEWKAILTGIIFA